MPGPDPHENNSQDGSSVNISGGENTIRGDVIGGDKIIQGDVNTATIGENARVGQVAVGTGITQIYNEAELSYDVHGLANPYLGLSAFKYEDRAKYAGREKLIAETVAKITAPGSPVALLFITGVSGSGKSSFAQAGLLPALEKFYDRFTVKHAVMRPAGDPFAAWNDALWRQLRVGETLEVSQDLKGLEATPPNQINLLVLDQFEEFFTQAPQAAREQFFAFLADVPKFAQTRTHIIATMRADYLPELFSHSALYQIQQQGVPLRAMNADELAQAIQQPLRASPYAQEKRFVPALVEKLAQDAAQDAAYLPLLQVTLEEIWRKGSLKLEAYTNLTDAIKQRADQVLEYRDFDDATPDEKRDPAEQAALLNLLLDLVDVSSDDDIHRDVRKQRAKTDLTRGDPQRERWLNQLSAARLLSIQQEGKDMNQIEVDLIHETLLTNWTRLQAAIAERRSELRHRARFEQNLNEWLAQDCSVNYLLEGVRLAEARELEASDDIALHNENAKSFLRLSVQRAEAAQQAELERERQRVQALEKSAASEKLRAEEQLLANKRLRQRAIFLVGAFLLALLAVGAAVFFLTQSNANLQKAESSQATAVANENAANQAKNEAIASANEARARSLVAQANQVFDKDPLLAVRLGLEGLALTSNADTNKENALTNEVAALMNKGRVGRLGNFPNALYALENASYLVVGNADASGELRRWSDGGLLANLAGYVMDLAFSPDAAASSFVVTYEGSPGELRRASDGTLLAKLSGEVYGVYSSHEPTANAFLVSYAKGPGRSGGNELRRWSDAVLLAKLSGYFQDNGVNFSPDAAASTLELSYMDAPGELWRTSDGSLLAKLSGIVSEYGNVYYSPDAAASVLVVPYTDAPGELRRTSDGALLAKLAGKVKGVDYSPDAAASAFVVAYMDAPDELRRTSDGAVLAKLAGMVSFRGVDYSPDAAASAFVVAYADASGELRRTQDGALLAKLAGKVSYVEYSPDAAASAFVVRYEDAPDELRRTSDGAVLVKLSEKVDKGGVHFSPDAAASSFVVTYDGPPGELRRTSDGALLATLSGNTSNIQVYFSPDAATRTFVVGYYDAPGELRRWTDGGLVAKLTGKVEDLSEKHISPDAAASTFMVQYADAPIELRRWSDGGLIAQLTGKGHIRDMTFSPDATMSAFAVRYLDVPAELRRTSDGGLITELGLVGDVHFDSRAQRLAFTDNDRHAYLLDLDFLRAYGGPDAKHTPQELEALGCKYLFAPYHFDESKLKEYLGDTQTQVCKTTEPLATPTPSPTP